MHRILASAGLCLFLLLGDFIQGFQSCGRFDIYHHHTILTSKKDPADEVATIPLQHTAETIVDVESSQILDDINDISRRQVMLTAAAGFWVLTATQPAEAAPSTSIGSTTWEETVSGFLAGASLTCLKTFVKYPLDTAAVRLQMPNSTFSVKKPVELFEDAFNGISNPLVLNVPGGALFFALKDATKAYFKLFMPKWMATCLAVFIANFPYWLVRNPSEVIKTKQQAKDYSDITAWEAFQLERSQNGLSGFYVGYQENIIYAYPADVLKFLIYEQLTTSLTTTTPLEGALAGACATAIAQFFTTPLDVVRNRVMTSNTEENQGMMGTLGSIYRSEGWQGLLAGVSPRIAKAIISGAIQFATYEETKQQVLAFFQRQAMSG